MNPKVGGSNYGFIPILMSYILYVSKSLSKLIVYLNYYMRTLVPETGVSDRDNCLPMPEIRASVTGVPVCVSVY